MIIWKKKYEKNNMEKMYYTEIYADVLQIAIFYSN